MTTFTVDTLSDDPAAGLTLREALVLADGDAAADTIEFAAGIQGGTVRITGGELTVASDVTIDGGTGVTIDANGFSRVLFVAAGSDTDANEVTLDSLTVTGGRLIVGTSGGQGREDAGGGIYASKYTSLSLTGSTVRYNAVTGDQVSLGGGIFAGGSLALTDSTVSSNNITANNTAIGGGIFAANVTLTNSLVSNNIATADVDTVGGGIFADRGATVTNSTLRFNRADGDYGSGGGIYTREGLILTDSDVNSNSASANAGGILAIGGLDVRDSTVQYNSAAGRGGGIFAAAGSIEVSGSTISGNSTTGADGQGGGIFTAYGGLSLTNTTVTGNSTVGADADGGGIFAQYGALSVTLSTLTGNSVAGDFADGGGIYVSPRGGDTYQPPAANLTVANSIVAGNEIGAGSGADVFGAIDTSNGHNLFGSAVTGAVAGDIEDADPASIFATGLLADNGGPTRTIALRNDVLNPALGGGADLGLTTDQRGYSRPGPAGTDPDIGAFELGGLPPVEDIVGTSGKDFLVGTAGDDVIRGLANADILWGQGGDDRLFGGNGKDSLFGKAGIDQLTGGLGADRFVFRATAEASPDGPAYEEILDFNRGQGDRIDLRTIDADDAKPGNQPFKFIGDDPLTGPAQLSVQAFDGDFLVTASTDADADAEFAVIVRTDLASLRPSDFLL